MNNLRIEIGKPEDGWLCTAIVNFDYHHLVSSNDVSYWCYLNDYGIEAKIGKQSPEGAQITKAIKSKVSLKYMETIIISLVLPHLKPHQFIEITHNVRREGYTAGKNFVRESLAKLMEIEY